MSEQIIPPEETIEAADGGKPRRSFDPAFKRNMKIVGGFLALAVGLVVAVALRSGGRAQTQQADSSISLGTGQTQKVDSVTPEMARKVEQKQRQEAADAERHGQTYIPPDSIGELQPVAARGSSAGPSSYAVGAAPVTVNAAPAPSATDLARREGLERQLQALLRDSPDSGGVRQRVEAQTDQSVGHGGTTVASGAATPLAAASATSQPAAKSEVVGGLTIHPAELTSEIKIPAGATGFATGRITAGPAAGAFLTGTAKVVDESLEIAFTKMRLNGKVYNVDARVLDEATAGAAIDGSVDRRLLQRYVFPVALAMAQGFYSAKSQTGNTVVVIGTGTGSSAALQTPPPTNQQAVAAGVAKGLELATNDVQRAAQQPIVVSQGRGFPVGILFNAAVTEPQ